MEAVRDHQHEQSHIGMDVAIIASTVVEWALMLVYLLSAESPWGERPSATALYLAVIAAVGVCVTRLIFLDAKGRIAEARIVTRVAVLFLVVAFCVEAVLISSLVLALGLILQFACVLWYQMATDPCLNRHAKQARYKGFIPLNFFNLFWIFIVCSVVGLIGETVVSAIIDGHWESRAGFVWGPFSSIYGVGGVLITVALNRLKDKNVFLLWFVAGLVGGALELLAGWLLENALGIVAWSYIDRPLNIHGYTCAEIAIVWGFIGIAWMKVLLPLVMKLIDKIPVSWRVPVTVVFGAFIFLNAYMTVTSLNYWFKRTAGLPINSPTAQFYAEYFNDEFMRGRFETMSMYAELASR